MESLSGIRYLRGLGKMESLLSTIEDRLFPNTSGSPLHPTSSGGSADFTQIFEVFEPEAGDDEPFGKLLKE